MKSKIRLSVLIITELAGLFFCVDTMAQLKLSAELRPRTEYSHGYAMPAAEDQNSSLFTSQRTRINFDYINDQNVKLKIVLQDVRLWGSQPQLVGNEDFATSVHQAWGEFNLNSNISLKAGRQELVYDDARILGNVGWAQQARSHDVILIKYSNDFNLHVGIAHHENGDRTNNYYEGPDAYKNLQFAWFTNRTNDITYSLLFLNNGVPGPIPTIPADGDDQDVYYSQTIGGKIETTTNDIRVGGNIYYQMGEDGTGRNLSAFEIALEAHKDLESGLNAGVRYELLSGTDVAETDNNSFTPLYGTNHKFNGFMDYFYVGNHTNSIGLHNLQFTGTMPFQQTTLRGDIHYFASHKEFDNGNFLGVEVDLGISLPIKESVLFSAGYSQMFASDRLALLKGITSKGRLHNWAYLMVTFMPGLL